MKYQRKSLSTALLIIICGLPEAQHLSISTLKKRKRRKLVDIAKEVHQGLVLSVILRATILQAPPLRKRTATVRVQKDVTINYSLLTMTAALVMKSVVERHNIYIEQLDFLLDRINQSFSITTTIDSNDKLSWKRLRRYTT